MKREGRPRLSRWLALRAALFVWTSADGERLADRPKPAREMAPAPFILPPQLAHHPAHVAPLR